MTSPQDERATPDYVHPLISGGEPTDEDLRLDTDTLIDLARQVREIEEARASAAVSGRDYLIR